MENTLCAIVVLAHGELQCCRFGLAKSWVERQRLFLLLMIRELNRGSVATGVFKAPIHFSTFWGPSAPLLQ